MSDFTKIRDNVDIIEVYEMETGHKYRRQGSPCCFCDSSDAVHFKNNRYKCFSCGFGGGVVDFVAQLKQLSPIDAGKFIETKYLNGYAVDIANAHPNRPRRERRPEIQCKFNPTINARFWELCHDADDDPELSAYLNRRGFTPDVREVWHITTITPDDFRRIDATLKREFRAADLLSSGLFYAIYDDNEQLREYKLLFRQHRILLFNCNDSGAYISVTGRVAPSMSPDDVKKVGKYRTQKGERYPFCTAAIYNARKGDTVVITEGELDAIALNELGTPAVSVGGCSGANNTRVFRGLLEKIAARGLSAVCGFDNDAKGKEKRDAFDTIAATVQGLTYYPEPKFKDTSVKDFADTFKNLNGEGITPTLREKRLQTAERYINAAPVLQVRELAALEQMQPYEIRRGFMDLIQYFNFNNITFTSDYQQIKIS